MNIQNYLKQHEDKDLLRFLTCGSVDDGKSTLIGRLLFDTKQIYEDQLTAIKKESKNFKSTNCNFDPALLTDGLKAEREQGITIDVAYRYFSTDKRKFIIADTPGHTQYTRNMATGASNCDLAIILIDARNGISEQTRRHSFIVSLLGIKHVIVAINKMDLIHWDKSIFDKIKSDYLDFVPRLDFSDMHFVPISALNGDNITSKSSNSPWYDGQTLLAMLENITVSTDRNLVDMRLPIQNVIRPSDNFRGFAGRISSGVVRKGMEVIALPSKQKTKVKSIVTFDGEISQAFSPMSVVLTFDNEIDVSRGTILASPQNTPKTSENIDAMIIWMGDKHGEISSQYTLKHCTTSIGATLSDISYKIDVNTLSRKKADKLKLNEVAKVKFALHKEIYFDQYKKNKELGSFILIDKLTNETAAAGMIIDRSEITDNQSKIIKSTNIKLEPSLVKLSQREEVFGHSSMTIWLTGLSGSGKSTIAKQVESIIINQKKMCYILDGDNIRFGLNRDLGFSDNDRKENIRRIAEVAKLMNQAGIIVITAFISPFIEDRENAKKIIGADKFKEVFISTPIDECEKRDSKGLYHKARNGEILNFTGIDSVYEAPENPILNIDTSNLSINQSVEKIISIIN